VSSIRSVERLETARGELVLRVADGHYEIISNGTFLMDTRGGASERLLVSAALAAHPSAERLLIGGLGVGFSLLEGVRAAALTTITVVEIEPAIVAWHRTHLAHLSGAALADPRVSVVLADLVGWLADTDERFDVVCLDIDNGPEWTVVDANDPLYGPAGTASLRRRLRPGGVLAVWSSAAAPGYEALLRATFDRVEVLRVPVARGEPDVVYLACAARP
jgi:spermidine synthase